MDNPTSIPLQAAGFCLDCERIFQMSNAATPCPSCGSRTVWRLASWIMTTRCRVPYLEGLSKCQPADSLR
jgi:predicted RNA-binding Zn-ribbon protein involved in translation (DUF1610 family)